MFSDVCVVSALDFFYFFKSFSPLAIFCIFQIEENAVQE